MSHVATPTTRGRARGNSGGRLLGEASGLGAQEVFDTAAIEAELEQAGLNANHNRRPGGMYQQAKRAASGADAGKAAKRVRWNPDLEEPSISAKCFTPRRPGRGLDAPHSNEAPLWGGEPRETDDGSVSEHARRAVALARESTSRSNRDDDPGVLFLSPKSKTFSSPGMFSSARPTGRVRGGSLELVGGGSFGGPPLGEGEALRCAKARHLFEVAAAHQNTTGPYAQAQNGRGR